MKNVQAKVAENKTIIIGMTGKIDSVVTAYLLKKQGHKCIGVAVLLSDYDSLYDHPAGSDPFYGPQYIRDIEQVNQICNEMDIPFYGVNAQDIHRERVTEKAINCRLLGHSFFPSIMLNVLIIEALIEKMKMLKASMVATGHYARVSKNPTRKEHTLMCANDLKFDQSYELSQLREKHLQHLLFPLAEVSKGEVEKISQSLEINFVKNERSRIFGKSSPTGNFFYGPEFLAFFEKRVDLSLSKKGNFYNYADSFVLGPHEGVHSYHTGQSNLNLRNDLAIDPNYKIVKIEGNRGNIYVSQDSSLRYSSCSLIYFYTTTYTDITVNCRAYVKVAGDAPVLPCTLYYKNNNTAFIEFRKEQEGVLSVGSYLTVYNKRGAGARVIGGGVVRSSGIWRDGKHTYLPLSPDGLEEENDHAEAQQEEIVPRF